MSDHEKEDEVLAAIYEALTLAGEARSASARSADRVALAELNVVVRNLEAAREYWLYALDKPDGGSRE